MAPQYNLKPQESQLICIQTHPEGIDYLRKFQTFLWHFLESYGQGGK